MITAKEANKIANDMGRRKQEILQCLHVRVKTAARCYRHSITTDAAQVLIVKDELEDLGYKVEILNHCARIMW